MPNLPYLFPTSRSGRKCTLSKQYWGTLFFCVEHPDGVLIDRNGCISMDHRASDEDEDEDDRRQTKRQKVTQIYFPPTRDVA